MVFYGAEND